MRGARLPPQQTFGTLRKHRLNGNISLNLGVLLLLKVAEVQVSPGLCAAIYNNTELLTFLNEFIPQARAQ